MKSTQSPLNSNELLGCPSPEREPRETRSEQLLQTIYDNLEAATDSRGTIVRWLMDTTTQDELERFLYHDNDAT